MVPGKGRISRKRRARLEKISRLLLHSYTPKQIAPKVGVSYNTARVDINHLRKTAVGSILPRKGKHFLDPKKEKRVRDFIAFAKNVIAEKEKLRKPPKILRTAQFMQASAMLKKQPLDYDKKIANAVGVKSDTVRRWRKQLVAESEIPDVTRGDRQKFFHRGTARGVLTNERIQEVVDENTLFIKSKHAEPLYNKNKEMFDFFKMNANVITEILKRRLASRLEIYDPKNMSGPERTKLKHSVSHTVWRCSGQLKYQTEKRYRHALATGRKPVEKPAVKKPEPLSLKYLENKCRQLNLTLLEEAAFFSLIANISNRETGKHIGYTGERVGQIKADVKKLAKAISK